MQPKYAHNKSNVIKITENIKRKSRQRLIGSIILLFFALILLLNVTSQIKPIAINPSAVEIKHIDSNSGNNSNDNVVITNLAESSTNSLVTSNLNISDSYESSATLVNLSESGITDQIIALPDTNSNTTGSDISAQPSKKANSQTSNSVQPGPSNTSKSINDSQPKPQDVDPIAILDGLVEYNENKTSNQVVSKVYIQLMALKNSETAYVIRDQLESQGISATVIKSSNSQGDLYRLRVGPYSKEVARKKLHELKNKGFDGIVTSQ